MERHAQLACIEQLSARDDYRNIERVRESNLTDEQKADCIIALQTSAARCHANAWRHMRYACIT